MEHAVAEPIEVIDAPERSRFEIRVDGNVAGFLDYRRRPGVVVFLHTEISDDHQGHGLAGRLAAAALEAVRDQGMQIRPVCEYLAHYVQRHPEWTALLEPRSRPTT